ncbi:MAG TPA: phosphoribosylanthranilate isomerase [Mariprofundaceae bacterium]|nr:phosphoribosylanthranilate isomerase [Mariprofundaceae bacterium]
MRTRIKVCGITRVEDALFAADLGVDALGFVFYDKSPRFIPPIKAAAIIRQLPPYVTAAGLFVNPSEADIADVVQHCPLDVLQLHGDESPEFCEAQRRRVVKAVPVAGAEDLHRAHAYHCPVLLDARAPEGVYGGTGQRFDWRLLEGFEHDHPLILAGGLDAENVEEAVAIRHWFAVDVSSGVESMPGVKDHDKLRDFVSRIR